MENLAPLIFFALIGLIQLLVRWVRRVQQQQQEQERRQRPSPAPDDVEESRHSGPMPAPIQPPPKPIRVPAPVPRVLVDNRVPDDEELMLRRPARSAPATPPRPVARRRMHPRIGSRADVRRAVVLMEILGPPRAAVDVEARGGR